MNNLTRIEKRDETGKVGIEGRKRDSDLKTF